MDQLYQDLLFYYIPEVRPSEHPSNVTLVYFTSYLIQLIDVVGQIVFSEKYPPAFRTKRIRCSRRTCG